MEKNSHYVPRQTLRKFGDRLCIFNVRTGEYFENVKIDKIFSEKGFYTLDIEDKLNKKIESQFGNLFANKLIKCDEEIALTRDELRLIKKFLLISVIRSYGNEEFLQKERRFYDDVKEYSIKNAAMLGLNADEIKNKPAQKPFEEKVIDNETLFDYWMRTLNVILDTDGTPEGILKHPDKTYPAYRWAEVINNGYVAFWDSNFDRDEFIITDVGMTSENEKGWNGTTVHNVKKTNFLLELLKNEKDERLEMLLMKEIHFHRNFTENFMMFPISAKRMIVEIDPFFKFRFFYKNYYQMPELSTLTEIPNEELFSPNTVEYILPQSELTLNYHKDDKYIYKIKKLSSKETRYCNELFFDRINTWVGFSSLNKVVGSIFGYKKANTYPFVPRVDYTELYRIVNERFNVNIDIDSIMGFRR